MPDVPPPPPEEPLIRRRLYITKHDVRTCGWTKDCARCQADMRGRKSTVGHSEQCRARIEAELAKTERGRKRIRIVEERFGAESEERAGADGEDFGPERAVSGQGGPGPPGAQMEVEVGAGIRGDKRKSGDAVLPDLDPRLTETAETGHSAGDAAMPSQVTGTSESRGGRPSTASSSSATGQSAHARGSVDPGAGAPAQGSGHASSSSDGGKALQTI